MNPEFVDAAPSYRSPAPSLSFREEPEEDDEEEEDDDDEKDDDGDEGYSE